MEMKVVFRDAAMLAVYEVETNLQKDYTRKQTNSIKEQERRTNILVQDRMID